MNQYSVNSPLISNGQRVAFISDIHGNATELESIINVLLEAQINTLLIGGDIIDTNEGDIRNEKIRELLEELSKTINIFTAIGNHDLVYFQQDSKTRRHEVLSKELDFWKKINSSKEENLHISSLPINNPTITKWTFNKDIDITALNLPIEYYWRKELTREFEEYLEIIKSITINAEKFNILLCHTPKNIIKNGAISDYLNYLKSFNLILSGHMHGGLVPKVFRKNSFGGGLFGPYASILPKHAYGIVQTDNTISLTSTGITKIANSTEIKSLTNNIVARNIIEFVYPPEIEIIDLNPGESYTIKRSK